MKKVRNMQDKSEAILETETCFKEELQKLNEDLKYVSIRILYCSFFSVLISFIAYKLF